jgi:MFS transporter, PAT family, beta-lactamase induction signal transducer AmpG
MIPRLFSADSNLLSTKRGKSIAFFSFYFIDGVLISFMLTAIAMQMERRGVSESLIGIFGSIAYLPAAWKWLFGPLVDLCYSKRLGKRRGWILGTEAMMIVLLLVAMPIDFVADFKFFALLMFSVNLFAALQRIAVNALACAILAEDERGSVNGMMYAGAYLGQIMGGSGVIFLSKYLNFEIMYVFIAGIILMVMLLFGVPLREPELPERTRNEEKWTSAFTTEVSKYAVSAYRAFCGSRAAMVGLLFVLLPAGGYFMSLPLGTNLMVKFGMSENMRALLTLIPILVAAVASMGGGFFADLLGRRITLAVYIVGTAACTIVMGSILYQYGWIHPDKTAEATQAVIVVYWIVTLVGSGLQGLLFATRSALYMDICTPVVAATQFTAYMAMVNLSVSYSSLWHGWAVGAWGYPATMILDAAIGLIGLPLLLFMTPAPQKTIETAQT